VARGHFVADITSKKILDAGYWWPTLFKDIDEFCRSCDSCQRIGGLKAKSLAKLVMTLRRTFYEMGSRFYKFY
jgi:hypothetical protein